MQEKEILNAAIEEVKDEIFRSEVEKKKSEIRESLKHKKWWHKFIPFKLEIKIQRREQWKL